MQVENYDQIFGFLFTAMMQLGPTLKKLFLASQTLAVGMEQVILDRAIYGGDFLEEFAIMENRLGMVICCRTRKLINH